MNRAGFYLKDKSRVELGAWGLRGITCDDDTFMYDTIREERLQYKLIGKGPDE